MAVLTVTIQLPVRAALWLHKVCLENRCGIRGYLEVVVLRHLEALPGVDLSRSPGDLNAERLSNLHLTKGANDGEESNRSE